MRLLEIKSPGKFSLTDDIGDDHIPPYAILSHTWGPDAEEVTFKDLVEGTGQNKAGYQKLRFCGERAANDGLKYFWVDTCCIDKSNLSELTEAINSMFRWYKNATECYVYLSDVSVGGSDKNARLTWKLAFRQSRWFTRGWTLQELIAPKSVGFFSLEGERLGDKESLQQLIHEITGIAIQALRGGDLNHFGLLERMSWAAERETKRKEDMAYSLLGIFDIHMPPIYGEGKDHAFIRLIEEIEKFSKYKPYRHRSSSYKAIPRHILQQLSLSDRVKVWMKRYRTEIAASSASWLSTFFTFPLDTIKTRLQSSYNYKSFLNCVEDGYRTEGVKGFWRGIWSPLLSITFVRTISFSIYQQAKFTIDEIIFKTTGTSPLVVAETPGSYPNWSTVLCFGASGVAAGAATAPIQAPFELTKNAQQLAEIMANRVHVPGTNKDIARSYHKKGALATARQVIKHRGVLGLYSGFSYILLRDTIGTGAYFMTYESVKQMLTSRSGNPVSAQAVAYAGVTCGLVSWACIFPIDTAKTRYQINCLTSHKDQTKVSPIRFFDRRMYRGITASMIRSCVTNVIFFEAYEFAKQRINALEVDLLVSELSSLKYSYGWRNNG